MGFYRDVSFALFTPSRKFLQELHSTTDLRNIAHLYDQHSFYLQPFIVEHYKTTLTRTTDSIVLMKHFQYCLPECSDLILEQLKKSLSLITDVKVMTSVWGYTHKNDTKDRPLAKIVFSFYKSLFTEWLSNTATFKEVETSLSALLHEDLRNAASAEYERRLPAYIKDVPGVETLY